MATGSGNVPHLREDPEDLAGRSPEALEGQVWYADGQRLWAIRSAHHQYTRRQEPAKATTLW